MAKTDAEKAAIKAARKAEFKAKPLERVKRSESERLRKSVHQYLTAVDAANGDYTIADAQAVTPAVKPVGL